MVITGKGNYTDHIDLLYMITSVSIDSATVKYAEYDNIYNGSAKKPKVTSIVTEDGTTITDLNAFDVTYTNNVDAGTATITVKPKSTNSNYTGTASKPLRSRKQPFQMTPVRSVLFRIRHLPKTRSSRNRH